MPLYIGLMSGTSMDGIDAALVDLPSHQLIGGLTKKYPSHVKKAIEKLSSGGPHSLATLYQTNTLVGQAFAEAALDLLHTTQYSPADIVAIGSHGQTIEHNVQCTIPYTIQIGCGHTISALTRIKVVADFRTRDVVNGGQGAPFAPLYHQQLFANADIPIALVNIGGIANVTFIAPHQPILGWDIGPGNCLMDGWISRHKSQPFDYEGSWAREGKVIQSLLDKLLSDSYLQMSAPKSIGKEYFSLRWLQQYLSHTEMPQDVQATLLAFTVQTIVDTLKENKMVKQLYLCGGGVHNIYLRERLARLLPQVDIQSTESIGVSPDYIEAMLFAWLAEQTINNIAVDFSTITGAKKPAILGAIYPSSI